MEYVLLFLSLGIVAGCAIGGYGLLDAVERDEDLDRARVADHARAVVLLPVRTTSPGEADADRLDGRIRGLEQQLDRLERACRRVEASRSTSR